MGKKKAKIAQKEGIWYVFAGVFALAAIALFVTSIVGDSLNVLPSTNGVYLAEDAVNSFFGGWELGFRGLGIILLSIGAIIAVIDLCYNAKAQDREVDKELRRQQRVQSFGEPDTAPEVVEVESALLEQPVKPDNHN
jgi:hypothetical protein